MASASAFRQQPRPIDVRIGGSIKSAKSEFNAKRRPSRCAHRRRVGWRPRPITTTSMSTAAAATTLATTLAPQVGIVTSTLLYFSPLSAVMKAVSTSDIGDLNPVTTQLYN